MACSVEVSGHTGSNSLGLTQEDFAILCRADHQSPVLIKMIVGDDNDAQMMSRREIEKGRAILPWERWWATNRRQWFPSRWGIDDSRSDDERFAKSTGKQA